MLNNHDIAKRIKEDRQKKMSAISRSIYLKKNAGDMMRSESRRLRDLRE